MWLCLHFDLFIETKKMQTPGSSFPPIRAAIVANDLYIPALVCNSIIH